MTQIICDVKKSGTNQPLNGAIEVRANGYLANNQTFYTGSAVRYPLVAGAVSFELEPSDLAKVAYKFTVIEIDAATSAELTAHEFEARIPFSPTPINFVTLAPQSGIRWDRRDASLLTLARFLTTSESFLSFLGGKLWANKGTYNPNTIYQRGNVVLYGSSSYQVVSESQPRGIAPSSDPAIWALLAEGGGAGGSSRFATFEARPNWGLGDAGKTATFDLTGHIHYWDGTKWTVRSDALNVLDYGVKPGTGDNSTALQAIIADNIMDSGKQRPLYFPAGRYKFNINMPWEVPNIRGDGNHSTFFSSYTLTGAAFTITRNNNWRQAEWSDFTIMGDSDLKSIGIRWGRVPNTDFDQFCAGINCTRIEFRNLDIALQKLYGNIGNSFSHCEFADCNYHYVAYGVVGNAPITPGDPAIAGMNSGCDTFYKCEMQGARVAAIYSDGKNSGVNGQLVLRDTIIEQCAGFGVYIRRWDNQGSFAFSPSLVLENTWFEFNASAATVSVFGAAPVKPYTIQLEETNAVFSGQQMYDIKLIKSKVLARNVGVGLISPLSVERDIHSFLIMQGAENNGSDTAHYVEDMHYKPLGVAYSLHSIGPNRNRIQSTADNVIHSMSFSQLVGLTVAGAGTVVAGGTRLVPDGLLFPRSTEVVINSTNNNTNYLIDDGKGFNWPADKFIFWSLEVKRISGAVMPLSVAFGQAFPFCNSIPMMGNGWQTIVGLGDTFGLSPTKTTGLKLDATGLTGTFRLGAYQLLAFDTLQELEQYSLSAAYRNPSDTGAPVQIGTMCLFSAYRNPAGWLKCDNSQVLRTAYPRLFAEIGTAYGAGDSTTTFNLPDSPILGDSMFFIYADT